MGTANSSADILETTVFDRRIGCPRAPRCRIRHFTDGVAIGSKAFIEEVFQRYRPNFGPRRVDGARRIPPLSAGLRLMNLRDLGANA